MNRINQLYLPSIFFLTSALLLSACGGGGSGDGNNPPTLGEPIQTLSISAVVHEEGSDGGTTDMRFTVTLDASSTRDVIVEYTTKDVTTEAPDFTSTVGKVTIPAGDTEATIAIGVMADTAFELDEEFTVVLSNPSANAVIGTGEAPGVIVNDDELVVTSSRVWIGWFDLAQTLPGIDFDMLFDLSGFDLSRLLGRFDIYYEDGINLPLLVASGNLTTIFSNGSGRLAVQIPPLPDLGFGIGGQFLIKITLEYDGQPVPGNNELIFPIDEQRIDPRYPRVMVSDVSVNEGDAGTTTDMVFSVNLDQPVATPVVVSYQTIDATASASEDYVAASGSVTIPVNQTTGAFSVTVNGDADVEGLEGLSVALSVDSGAVILQRTLIAGFIVNDDLAPDSRRLTVQDAELAEGDAGTANMVFEVTLDQPAQTPVHFGFATRGDSAIADSDYEETVGGGTFQPSESRVTIEVPVFADTDPEDDETFLVIVLFTSANVTGSIDAGVGTIRSDDPLTRVSIADIALAEGDTGDTTTFSFAVSLSEPLNQPLLLDVVTTDVTATAGEDYTALDSSITIAAGDLTGVVEVVIEGDDDSEDDEVFQVVLSTASASVLLLDDTAEGTLLNDDADAGWAGAELVHAANPTGFPGTAVRPQVGFGPGAERHVIYLQNSAVWSRLSTVPGIWEAPEQVDPAPSLFRTPQLAVDTAGRALAVWPDTVVASSSYLTGTGWQTEPLPAMVDVRNELRLAGDPASGEAIVLWDEPANAGNGNFTSVWAARFVPGVGWQDMGLVETAEGEAFIGDVAMGANGKAMAVFMQPPGASGFTDIVAYRLVGNSWIGPTILDSVDSDYANLPRIDMDAAGNAAVTWFQEEPVTSGLARPSIYVNRYDAAADQWSGAVLVENDLTHSARDPDVAIDANGNVVVIWLQQSPDYSTEDLMANRYDAGSDTWSGAQPLEFDDTSGGRPIVSQQVVADDLGNAIAVWVQNDGALQNLRGARYSFADGQWLPAELLEELDTGDANGPHLVVQRSTGDAMVVWHHANGTDVDIWANRYTN